MVKKIPPDLVDQIVESRRAMTMGQDELLGRGLLSGIVGIINGRGTDARAMAYLSEFAMRANVVNESGKLVRQPDREIDMEEFMDGVASEIQERTANH